jgi:hypothetical protein
MGVIASMYKAFFINNWPKRRSVAPFINIQLILNKCKLEFHGRR